MVDPHIVLDDSKLIPVGRATPFAVIRDESTAATQLDISDNEEYYHIGDSSNSLASDDSQRSAVVSQRNSKKPKSWKRLWKGK